jgi:hypothetical protein
MVSPSSLCSDSAGTSPEPPSGQGEWGVTPRLPPPAVIRAFDNLFVYPVKLRGAARSLHAEGMSFRGIGRVLGVPYHTIRYWCAITKTPDERYANDRPCPRCLTPPGLPVEAESYAYLLGLYLGDGYITATRVPVLRIACALTYPGIIEACDEAMRAVLARSVQRFTHEGRVDVQSCSTHWPCLFPQAGPGPKHSRRIELEAWQRQIVSAHPGPFARGLFHSDGSRFENRVKIGGRTYSYVRYMFSNESKDILALCGEALDLLGVEWRYNRRNSLSVAKRASVALLDLHVGVKR